MLGMIVTETAQGGMSAVYGCDRERLQDGVSGWYVRDRLHRME